MALETATYISDLVSTNPTASDNMSQGDDHIRLLKSTLKSTFPNVSGAVTATHTELNVLDGLTATTAELNHVDGVTSPLQTQLNTLGSSKAPLASPTFTGTVVLPATTSVGTVSATELGYLDGVTSALQTQIDGKAASVHTHATGDITGLGSLATLSSVGTSQITDSSVTTGKIADANITPAKLSGGQTGSAPVYGARAWVTFDGTVNPPTILSSGNIASVVRNGTGDYTIAFTTALPNANYAISGSAIGTGTDGPFVMVDGNTTPTSSAFRIQVVGVGWPASTANSYAESSARVSVVVFG